MWRRELQAFVFVFEAANRIVVEKPEYANATYFFDMEEPLPVAAQVIHPVPSKPGSIVSANCIVYWFWIGCCPVLEAYNAVKSRGVAQRSTPTVAESVVHQFGAVFCSAFETVSQLFVSCNGSSMQLTAFWLHWWLSLSCTPG